MPSPAEAAAVAVAYWVRDYDMRDAAPMVELDQATVLITPTSGLRIWVYCAELPWDMRDGPRRGRDPEGWCASNMYPEGEYGLIDPDDPAYTRITREQFLHAADNGWPDWKEEP